MQLTTQLLALTLGLLPLAEAAIFPKDTTVKMLDAKSFKKVMKVNQTSVVAFVAPWCGHCQRMAPEYSRAALGLYPLLPMYAVDCDAEKNKRLCAEQGVQGFPTIKLFPRGNTVPPMVYDGKERTASAFFYWASRRIPPVVHKIYYVEDIPKWVDETVDKNRILLLTKDKQVPLLWKVLANKYDGQLSLASHRDRGGKSSVALGYEAGEKKQPKVLVYPAGQKEAVRYQGINKFDSLSKFFDTILDGTADLKIVNEEAKTEEFAPSEEDLEIQRKQDAQRIALAHGGWSDIIDFEKAILEHGTNFHGSQGFQGMMGDIPYKKEKGKEPSEEEKAKSQEALKPEKTESGMPQTGKAAPTPTPAAEPVAEPIVEEPVVAEEPVVVEEPVQAAFTSEESERPKDEL
ncbi:hypothetical protein ONZ45_g13977 [Pleurotus djamor]|nr:hypothetical protein ONZ45_g13977 [Pleurotus djamor]